MQRVRSSSNNTDDCETLIHAAVRNTRASKHETSSKVSNATETEQQHVHANSMLQQYCTCRKDARVWTSTDLNTQHMQQGDSSTTRIGIRSDGFTAHAHTAGADRNRCYLKWKFWTLTFLQGAVFRWHHSSRPSLAVISADGEKERQVINCVQHWRMQCWPVTLRCFIAE